MSAELNQKTGSSSQIIYAAESAWGSTPAAGANVYRSVPLVGGETMDDNVNTYKSNIIRSDRTRNKSQRGTQRPGGSVPLELAAVGPVLYFLYALLGGTPVTTAAGSAVSAVQSVTTSGGATGGTYRLAFKDEYTAPLAYNAAASAIQTALENLSTIGAGNVTVAGTGPYTVTFDASLGNVPTLVADDGLLTGGTNPTVSATHTTYGVGATQYVHTLVGTKSNTLPSFTYEKGFIDPPPSEFQAFSGCRINQGSFQIGIDAVATLGLDILNRQARAFSSLSVSNGTAPVAAPQQNSFTSVQIELVKNGVVVGAITTLGLTINNNLYGDSGFVLGSNLRQSLKAGARDVTGQFTAIFADATFYNLAKNGDIFSLNIRCRDDLGNQLLFKMPQVQSLPNNSSPKIANDGPLDQSFTFESLYDSGIDSNIQLVVTTTTPVITV